MNGASERENQFFGAMRTFLEFSSNKLNHFGEVESFWGSEIERMEEWIVNLLALTVGIHSTANH